MFVAGQVADDAEGHLVGAGDLAAQARVAFANVGRCLAAAGARPDQVARITIYVVGHRPEYTLLGVQTLAEPGYLIEVEAIADVATTSGK